MIEPTKAPTKLNKEEMAKIMNPSPVNGDGLELLCMHQKKPTIWPIQMAPAHNRKRAGRIIPAMNPPRSRQPV